MPKKKKTDKPIPYRLAKQNGNSPTIDSWRPALTSNYETRNTPGNIGQYTGAVQPIDLILAQKLDFCEGSIVKYICRWKKKGGLLDLEKARQYLNWIIEEVKKEVVSSVEN